MWICAKAEVFALGRVSYSAKLIRVDKYRR